MSYILVSSIDDLRKQFEPRSGPTTRQAWSGSKLYDPLMVFMKKYIENVNFKRNRQKNTQHAKS